MIPTIDDVEKAQLKWILNQFGEDSYDDERQEEESYADLGF